MNDLIDQESVDYWKKELPAFEGRRLKIKVRKLRRDADLTAEDIVEGNKPVGFDIVDYLGVVQKPAIQKFKPDSNSEIEIECLFIKTFRGAEQEIAITLGSIVEVDDEIEERFYQTGAPLAK